MTVNKFKKLIKLETGVDVDIVSRKRNFVEVRALYYRLLRDNLEMTLQSIANTVKKDHATVLHSLNNIDNWMKYSDDLRTYYANIMQVVNSNGGSEISGLRYANIILEAKVKELTKQSSKLHELLDTIPKDKEDLVFERLSAIIKMNC
jgi:hypothetical protein